MSKNISKEIGGYFELDIIEKFDNIGNSIALNSARNCLRYIIRAFDIKTIWIPFYTCPVVWQSVKKEKCKIKFYHINKSFMPTSNFKDNDFILYTNYFGVCSKNVKELAKKYKYLIVDNSQAFYMPKYGIASFNSLRKFFGVPDGALLYSDKISHEKFEQDTSYQKFSHLLKRIDIDAKSGYEDFYKNEHSLINESVKTISNLTKAVFNSIDIQQCKIKRLKNYHFLEKTLSKTNELKITLDKNDVPMFYPYLVQKPGLRNKLTRNNIFTEQYWSTTPKEHTEGIFQKYLIPLPVDQRYSQKDMQYIINIITNSY